MNEIDILLAKPIDIEVGDKKYTFRHPSLEWWGEFVVAIGGAFDRTNARNVMTGLMSGKQDRSMKKAIDLFCWTLSKKPNDLKKELTLHQALALADKWLDCIGIEEARSFFGRLGGKIEAATGGKNTL